MMKDSLLNDPTFFEFNEMRNAASDLPGLYDAHDGREFNHEKSAWNDDYMNKLMVQVVGNFSHERVEHLKEVVGYLRPVATRSPQASPQSPKINRNNTTRNEAPCRVTGLSRSGHSTQKRQEKCSDNGASNRRVKIAVGAVAGGTIVWIVAGVVVGAVVGAVVGGTAVAFATKGER